MKTTTVAFMLANLADRVPAAREWGASAWHAWAPHHPQIRAWYRALDEAGSWSGQASSRAVMGLGKAFKLSIADEHASAARTSSVGRAVLALLIRGQSDKIGWTNEPPAVRRQRRSGVKATS